MLEDWKSKSNGNLVLPIHIITSWFKYCSCNSQQEQLFATFLDLIGLILMLLQPLCEGRGLVGPRVAPHGSYSVDWSGWLLLLDRYHSFGYHSCTYNEDVIDFYVSGVWVFDGVCVFYIIYQKHWYLYGIIAVVSIWVWMVLIQIILVYTKILSSWHTHHISIYDWYYNVDSHK